MERYDIAVIGTGPGGLQAAINARVRNKSVILLGKASLSAKLGKAHQIQNYLGLPDISGAEMAAAFQKHLDAMNVQITDKRVNAVYAMGDFFSIQAGEEMIEASSVILATGVVAGKTLPGEEALLGRGVSYCATCDAALYRGKNAIVIGYSAHEEAEAAFLSEIADEVIYIPTYAGEINLPEKIRVLRVRPLDISREGNKTVLHTDGESLTADGVFVLRDSVAPSQLVPGLAVDGAHVKVDRLMRTNIPGVFACGDIVGTPYQYIKAAGEGNIAALSAVAWLDAKKREAAK